MRSWIKTVPFLLVVAFVGQAGRAANVPLSSSAQKRIRQAEKRAEEEPGNIEALNRLAAAWIARGREIDSVEPYLEAERAAGKALQIDVRNIRAETTRIVALLGQNRFREALELAEALNRRNPDNVEAYGLIVDGALALGLYKEAEKACQWMLDLRPDQVDGLVRAAHIRELYGDLQGASDFLSRAYLGLPPDQPELQALTLVDLARTLRLLGQIDDAERVVNQALLVVPETPFALLELSRIRQAQRRLAEAVELLRKRQMVSSRPEALFDLAMALRESGRTREANVVFAEFEERARDIQDQPWNANRELILRYAERPERALDALRLADDELSRRRDSVTLLASAWALLANGRHQQARLRIDEALSGGKRHPIWIAEAERLGAALESAADKPGKDGAR